MKFDGFKKIESIKKLREYNLPIPETIFIFDFNKQGKEIEKFLKGKKIISVRSDSASKSAFCPNIPRCPRGLYFYQIQEDKTAKQLEDN